MISILMEMIEQLFSGTELLFPFLFLLFFLTGILMIHQKTDCLPRYLLASAVAESFILFFFMVLSAAADIKQPPAGFKDKLILWQLLLSVLFFCILLACLWEYGKFNKQLKTVVNYAKPDHYDYNLMEAWRQLNELQPSKLTPRQRKKYKRHRMYLCAYLGAFGANEPEMKKLENGNKKEELIFYHFLRFIQYWAVGRMEQAAEHIRQAEELCDADTDTFMRSQIMINRGVAYVGIGLYKDADDAFARAIHFCEKHHIKNKGLWVNLYYNYVFNKTRISPEITWEQLDSVFEQLKTHLDLEKSPDYLDYFNAQLELLRQINAGKEQLEEHVYYAFDYIRMSDLPDYNRCMFESSTARIIWAARLDPTYILQALTDDMKLLLQMPMPAKYRCLKDIDLFFTDLYGSITETYDDLKQCARRYMDEQAEDDLEDYRKSLPAEAVYERCFCFKEIAGIQKRTEQTYQWKTVEENFKNACALYHENGLELEEMMCNLALIDECSSILNTDEHFRFLRRKEMFRYINEVETFLPNLERHPLINEAALRLSFYCGILDDYDRCRKYYELYKETSGQVSLNHYAPWLHRYYMTVCFEVRVLYILETIKKIARDCRLKIKKESVCLWFENFGKTEGQDESFVLGRLLGYTDLMMLKRIVWREEETGKTCYHAWLVLIQLKMEIDITYQSVEQGEKSMFFISGQHPLENGTSKWLCKKKHGNPKMHPVIQTGTFGLGNYAPDAQQTMSEVCGIIEKELPKQCPSVENLYEAFQDVMLPVSAG